MNIVKELKTLVTCEILDDVYMKNYTTYKVGGKVIAMVFPETIEDLIKVMEYIQKNDIKYRVIGRGSNVIFNDGGYNGIIIKVDKFDYLDIKGTEVTVGAGYFLMKLAIKLSRAGFTGIEFATGIPGSVGGAVYMNAGAYNMDMGYIIRKIKVLTPDLKVVTMYNKDLDFHYRTSFLQNNPGYICLEATLDLKRGNPDVIIELIEERKKRRLITQPLEFPSAGSVFRNPEGDYAGRLIEELGYKNKGIGDAVVSEKHANFIINKGNAKGEEIKELINQIKKDVRKKYNIELRVEQEFIE